MIKIGYWYSEFEPHLPKPQEYVDLTWDPQERQLVIDYLNNSSVDKCYRGLSPCRFCGKWNGFMDLTDGTYLYPEGLVHYLEEHGVKLSDEFIAHVKSRG